MRSGPPRRAEPGERGDCEADHALRAWLGKPHLPVLGPPRRIQQPAVGPERHPKLCALRDLRGWYCSFYIYNTTVMTDNLLSRAIRLLVGGDATAVRDRGAGAILSRHRRAFLERFRKEDAGAGSIGNLSMEFVVWFTGTVRLEVMMNTWVGMDGMPAARTGFLTFRAITILFDDPGKVFRMRADERDAYFASGAYL